MEAIRLKTEYMEEPVGIGCTSPWLSWNCLGGIRQEAYQIQARTEEGKLLWDSGRVDGSRMHAVWGGAPVPCRTRVLWRIRLWDEDGIPGRWSRGSFETGLPEGEPWEAEWITGAYNPRKSQRYPVDCFRKKFVAAEGRKARLYLTACGLYEARLNGRRVGDFVLAPGITDYRKRVQYQVYDVAGLVKPGENELTIQLADGWYRGSCGAWGRRNQYGKRTRLLAQLELVDMDGHITVIGTDESWEWSNDGPIRFADNKDGEIVDARRTPCYHGRARVADYGVIPTASNNVPVREQEHFSPRAIQTPAGKTVLDFGQNIAGYLSFSVAARAGQKIILRFGEMLDRDGEFTQKNIQCSNKRVTTPLQQVVYTCKEGRNDYKATFAIFGFRYVLVQADMEVCPKDFTAIAVYSDLEETGRFHSSNPLLNQFVENTRWSAKNNSCDLPTDCPTRERHGWSGDAQIFCPTACFLFDYQSFARKYLNDMYDWQKPSGKLPQIAPEGGVDPYMRVMDGSVGWADAGILIPYVLWKQYGDLMAVKKYLPGMRRYAAFMEGRCGKWYPTAKHLGLKGEERRYLSNCGQAYGEWAEPEDVHHMTWKDCAVPHPEVATAYTAYVLGCMAQMEEALGNFKEAEAYRRFAAGCRNSYRALVKTREYSLDTDRQARLVRPLAFGLLEGEQEAYAKRRLLEALKAYGWRLGTGFLSTPLILDVLTGIDVEAAYRLLENEEMPGWLFMPKSGATTVWEAWEGSQAPNGGIASLNHYSKGAVCRWLFDTMCGIQVDGENYFRIAPRPGGHFSYARAEYTSVYGPVASGWERTGEGVKYTVVVPPNCRAQVLLPDGSRQEQGPGKACYFLPEGKEEIN